MWDDRFAGDGGSPYHPPNSENGTGSYYFLKNIQWSPPHIKRCAPGDEEDGLDPGYVSSGVNWLRHLDRPHGVLSGCAMGGSAASSSTAPLPSSAASPCWCSGGGHGTSTYGPETSDGDAIGELVASNSDSGWNSANVSQLDYYDANTLEELRSYLSYQR